MPLYPPPASLPIKPDDKDDQPRRSTIVIVMVICAIVVAIVAVFAALAVFGDDSDSRRDASATAPAEWTPPVFSEQTTTAAPATNPTPTSSPTADPEPTDGDPSTLPTYSMSPAPYPTVRPTANLPRPGTAGAHDGLTITVTGKCSDKGGMKLNGKGFTPGGSYLTQVWYPHALNYKQYVHLQDNGRGIADEQGHTPNWSWNCYDGADGKVDPAGVYTLLMVDYGPNNTGPYRWVYTTFQVAY